MAEGLTWWKGDRDPSISDQITVDDVPVDLSTRAATFKMRAFGATTLKVNQPVSFKDAQGNWRYDWAATDLDTAGSYLAWVEASLGGKVQTLWEFPITVAEHAPQANAYVELEEFKETLQMTGETFLDRDARVALVAASRGIDTALGQRFYADADANQVRYYTADSEGEVRIDPLVTLTSLATDPGDDGTYDYTWVRDTDFALEPVNATLEGRPFTTVRILSGGNYAWPGYPNRIKITGKFGWPAVPAEIKQLTTIVAARLVKRTREAPFGFISFGMDGATARAASIARDPEFQFLSAGLTRRRLLV